MSGSRARFRPRRRTAALAACLAMAAMGPILGAGANSEGASIMLPALAALPALVDPFDALPSRRALEAARERSERQAAALGRQIARADAEMNTALGRVRILGERLETARRAFYEARYALDRANDARDPAAIRDRTREAVRHRAEVERLEIAIRTLIGEVFRRSDALHDLRKRQLGFDSDRLRAVQQLRFYDEIIAIPKATLPLP